MRTNGKTDYKEVRRLLVKQNKEKLQEKNLGVSNHRKGEDQEYRGLS